MIRKAWNSIWGSIILFPVMFVVFMLVIGVAAAQAQSEVPDGVQVFHLDTGQTCIVWPDDSGECYCPCETGLCVVETEGLARRSIPTEVRDGGTPEPSPVHTFTPNSTPTSTPEVEGTVTPHPTKTPKPHCNKGEGNGDEGCDPGNHPERGNDDED